MGFFKKQVVKKTGLCLGGGGARGFAHIGALKAFAEENIVFDMVSGTSVGSMIAAAYAAKIPLPDLVTLAEKISLKEIHSGFTPNDPLKIGAVIRGLIGDKKIEDLPLPLYIVAVDLVEARQVIMDKGLIYEAVSASCAVPVFFKPLEKGKMHLVDGGLLNNIPADVLRMMGADNVVTVDINPTRGGGTEGMGLMDVIKATMGIVTAAASQMGLVKSDIIIAPDLSRFKSTKKEGYEEMINLGYLAAKEKIPAIKQLMGGEEKGLKKAKLKKPAR